MNVYTLSLFLLITGSLMHAQTTKTFYDFKVKTIDGADFDFATLKGKKVMIVNTASECGYTPQYKDLEELYKNYGGKSFVIIGFPANNFGGQEPGSNEEIKQFCSKQYQVSFPMMAKISVKGDDMHDLYKWLTTKSINGYFEADVKWNFNKFLIDETGHIIAHIESRKKPNCDQIIQFIKG